MMSPSSKVRGHSAVRALIILSMIILSCENKIPVIPKSDLLSLPSLTAMNFNIILTDSGKIQLIMSGPILEKFDKANPQYVEFKSGLHVEVFNGLDKPVAIVTSKYAKCTDNNLWELRDSVVVINDNNEILETELLFLNQEKDRIYTDRFVKITGENQVSQGIGFESDTHLSRRRFFKVTATITLNDEK